MNDARSGEDRRQQQADGSLPYWARIVLAVGVFPSLTIYLVWIITNNFSTAQAAGNKMLLEHTTTAPAMIEMLREHKESDLRLEVYMRMTCQRLSKTQAERDACNSVR